jgi:electron transport complex protein RnfC
MKSSTRAKLRLKPIARAKARKAAQQDITESAANDDSRKAAVAAAIARVQARKAAQAVNED